jgi:hypothetical protein
MADNSGPGSLLITIAQNIVTAINGLTSAVMNVWPRITGTFTLTATATFTVTQPGIKATSVVMLSPTNAAAGTLMGSAKSLYVSALAPGASFTVATASGAAATGTETFNYAVFNPS